MKLLSVLLLFTLTSINVITARESSRADIIGGPNGLTPYLFKSVSSRGLLKTARNNQWSINFHNPVQDTLNIVAIRVEFNQGSRDSSSLTTGNGLFGIYRKGGDKDEENFYRNDTTYQFDKLPHDSTYFSRQLDAVASYYKKVSRGSLTITYSMFPSGSGETGYNVDSAMTFYSPGGKKKKESWDDYYYRKTHGLLLFVKEAIEASDKATVSPFRGIRFQASDSTYRDVNNKKTVFLIFHAGSSYLTDGGKDGYLGQDTPSDMIDVFVTPEWFKYYKDTLKIQQNGIQVQGQSGPILINEIMMCSETSNQDGLNWGIQGILINQIARQMGIPDLHSTTSGISAIGSFCIMDFAGYSAGNGFIPPYPSAWVRAFMGWDRVKIAPIGAGTSYNVKSLTSVLDNNGSVNDTTILMVPINDHEYYLIENRQRDPGHNRNLFKYDTTEDKVEVIASYPYNVNLKVAISESSKPSNVVQKVVNNDISLPASGLLVWHIDERIIRERIQQNMVNADSIYRGVALVEADGANDLGVTFKDIFYQAAYDYGGSEDVFPHERRKKKENRFSTVRSMGPWSFPSTRSNDGGHSYINFDFETVSQATIENSRLFRGADEIFIRNYSSEYFKVSVQWDYQKPYWPKVAAPEPFFEPVLCELDPQKRGREFLLAAKSGRVYIWPSDTTLPNGYVFDSVSIDYKNFFGKTTGNAVSYYFYDSLSGVNAMPSVYGGKVLIPSVNNRIYILNSVSQSSRPIFDTIHLSASPSTYICVANDSLWAAGCSNGSVVFGNGAGILSTMKLPTDSAVCALSVIRGSNTFAVIQRNGSLSMCDPQKTRPDTTVNVPGIGPYTLVSGDLDADSASEIVVCDIKHGLWMYERNLKLADYWPEKSADWAAVYTISESNKRIDEHAALPDNPSPPALADINRDGRLDIIIGGTNGVYAFNYKGVLIGGWPAYLDTRNWYQKGSVISSPVIGTGKDRKPLVLFSTTTGDNLTYTISKVTRADKNVGKIWFRTENGTTDSIWGFKPSEIDTILNVNDSLILPYVLPGGFIDAVNSEAKRPRELKEGNLQSVWPISAGSPLQSSPMAGDIDGNGIPDIFGVTQTGWVYRWELGKEFIQDSLFWSMPGFDAGRSFAYGNALPVAISVQSEPVKFYNFPNPTNGSLSTIFRYAFSGPATNVRLDIFSTSGINVYSKTTMGNAPSELTGSFPDWNEHIVSLNKIGPGVYRCRLEAKIDGKKHVRYWKMAVVK